jgi:hypothetical protein
VAISGFTVFEAIVVVTIRVDRLDCDIVTGALTLRYGLLDRLQLETRIPALYRSDQEVLAVGTGSERERTISDFDLGDIEASLSWPAFIGRRALPDVILRLRSRFPTGKDAFEIGTERIEVEEGIFEQHPKEPPTGSGFYSVAPNLTLVWRAIRLSSLREGAIFSI